jgi:predicted NBD/HSP70 family sugar kinase
MSTSQFCSLLDVPPAVPAVLDPGYRPAALATRNYRRAVAAAGKSIPFPIALERNNGLVTRLTVHILPPGSPQDADTLRYLERSIKFLLYARGGFRLHLGGPRAFAEPLRALYSAQGARAFDADLMRKSFDLPFETVCSDPASLPAEKEAVISIGGHLEGCRIGFDLGASDYKIAAVIDGQEVFTTELPWTPSVETDPAYHYAKLNEGLKLAASHMPRVDAIGGSSAGIIINNEIKVASLFRSVPQDLFERSGKTLFQRLKAEWKIPFEVANDGDVTALAGALSLGRNAMLGVAMGSSEAGGYLDRQGRILGWLNELAFAPVDFNPTAVADEWSGDIGVGALYFSQQATNKLAPAAGFSFPADQKLPERLKDVQKKCDAGDPQAAKIFDTIGVYLGYTIPHYADFYDLENLLILGRVTSGRGGDIILKKAREVLAREFADVASRVTIHVPDEKSRRVGQAVAAASLPALTR